MYGATLILATPDQDYMQMEIELGKENPSWFMINQYDDLDNVEAHYKTTGPEIWNQTDGKVTHFVMGASTGGTISGVGRYLKEQNPDVKNVLIDLYSTPLDQYLKGSKNGLEEPSEQTTNLQEGWAFSVLLTWRAGWLHKQQILRGGTDSIVLFSEEIKALC